MAHRLLFQPIVRLPLATAVSILCLSGAAVAAPQAADLAETQAVLTQTQAERARLSASRAAVQSELDKLGQAIAEKKQALPAGAEPGADLTELLRASARLATQLDQLQKKAAEAQARSQQAADDLAHSCSGELGALQAQWSQSVASERPALEGRIAEVSKSCTGSRLGQADKAAGASIPASALAPAATDDAQALQQKADFLRDREDLLRHRIAQMSQRIEALSRERTLARRVSEFVKEQDLFDEDDTRVSAARTEYGAVTAPQPGASGVNAAQISQSNDGSKTNNPGANNGGAGGGSLPVGSANGGQGGSLSNNGTPPPTLGGVATPADAPSGVEGTQDSRQTYIGTRPEDLRVGDDAAGDDDSLEGLRAQRMSLEQEAKKLHDAATALERSASDRR
jgi:predicted  nucleic acid-binding Zn-ribbon protein